MSTDTESPITSSIIGVAYVDLVLYILPRAITLFGCLLITGGGSAALEWARETDNGTSILGLGLAFLAASYLTGIIISFPRWFNYRPLESKLRTVSLSRFLYGVYPWLLQPRPQRLQANVLLLDSVRKPARR